MREHETKVEAFSELYSIGQRVLRHSRTTQSNNLNVLYEWASYALYRQSVGAGLEELAGRALDQCLKQQLVRTRIMNNAQRALQAQIGADLVQVELEEIGQRVS